MAKAAGIDLSMPRLCARQTMRANISSESPEIYWRRAIFIPYLDNLIAQLSSRFTDFSQVAMQGLGLIPNNLANLTEENVRKIATYFEEDLPCIQSIEQEVELWRRQWQSAEKKPTNIQTTLQEMNEHLYPNISALFHILLLDPVTSKCGNSALRFIKTPLQ